MRGTEGWAVQGRKQSPLKPEVVGEGWLEEQSFELALEKNCSHRLLSTYSVLGPALNLGMN